MVDFTDDKTKLTEALDKIKSEKRYLTALTARRLLKSAWTSSRQLPVENTEISS